MALADTDHELGKDAIIARLERELALRDARITDAESRLQDLVYVASHDLVEPLRMIKSFLQLLERRNAGNLDERSVEFLSFAVDGADRMKALIDDLLRYSRAGSGDLVHDAVELDAAARGAVAALRTLIAEREATVEVAPGLPVVSGDAALLGQVIQNLVANAVKFRPEERGNSVRVDGLRDATEQAWRVVVTDDGIGFDAVHASRMLKPFQRLHARDEYPGTGIGLAICQRIAERHGGRIEASSTAGSGASFAVVLPDPGPTT